MKPPTKPFPADPGKGSRLIGRAGKGKVQWHGKTLGLSLKLLGRKKLNEGPSRFRAFFHDLS
jgi:hypothetical protein